MLGKCWNGERGEETGEGCGTLSTVLGGLSTEEGRQGQEELSVGKGFAKVKYITSDVRVNSYLA